MLNFYFDPTRNAYYFYGDEDMRYMTINYGTEDEIRLPMDRTAVFSVEYISTVELVIVSKNYRYKLPQAAQLNSEQYNAILDAGLQCGQEVTLQQLDTIQKSFAEYDTYDDRWLFNTLEDKQLWTELQGMVEQLTEEKVIRSPLDFTVYGFVENPQPDWFRPARWVASARMRPHCARADQFTFDGDAYYMYKVRTTLNELGVEYDLPTHSGTKYLKVGGDYLPTHFTRDAKSYGVVVGTADDCLDSMERINELVTSLAEYLVIKNNPFVTNNEVLLKLQSISDRYNGLDPKVKDEIEYYAIRKQLTALAELVTNSIR